MLTITYAELAEMKPCDLERRKAWFKGEEPLSVAEALEKGATIRDVLWVAQKLGRKDLCVRFALLCAQRVAHLNPDPRVQAALDATENWLNDPSEANRKAAPYAATADYAAADAADADAAAYAAYAADYADAAAYAATAAYAADYAAYAAAYADAAAYAATADYADAAAYAAATAAYAAADAAYAAYARQKEQEAQRQILIELFSPPS